MAGAWGQRQSDGTAPRLADGTTPRTTADMACCCGGTSTCPFCDAPLPTAYDFEFTGVTACPTHPALYTTTVTMDVYSETGGPPVQFCEWNKAVYSDATVAWAAEATIGVLPAAGHSSVGVSYERNVLNPPFTPILWNHFSGLMDPYGPDCTATILVSNSNTFAQCGTGNVAGYSGSAVGVPVLPP